MTQPVMHINIPSHPGELVRENLEELGLSVADAARALHVTRQQLYNVISGKSAVSPEMALRFEKAFGSSAEMWLRVQAAYDLAQARKRGMDMNIPRLVASMT
jgi:addiction module HigA family antidote